MTKFFRPTLLMFTATLIVACSQAPKDVARQYLEAVNQHEYEKAKNLGTQDIQERLDKNSRVTGIDDDKSKDRSYEILNEKISGDISNVTYSILNKGVKNEFNGKMRLVKTDGKWLVAENDPGYKEYLRDETIKQLKYEINQLKNQIELTRTDLPTELEKQKLVLLDSIKQIDSKVGKAVTFGEKQTIKEEISIYRYQITKFLADAENR